MVIKDLISPEMKYVQQREGKKITLNTAWLTAVTLFSELYCTKVETKREDLREKWSKKRTGKESGRERLT